MTKSNCGGSSQECINSARNGVSKHIIYKTLTLILGYGIKRQKSFDRDPTSALQRMPYLNQSTGVVISAYVLIFNDGNHSSLILYSSAVTAIMRYQSEDKTIRSPRSNLSQLISTGLICRRQLYAADLYRSFD